MFKYSRPTLSIVKLATCIEIKQAKRSDSLFTKDLFVSPSSIVSIIIFFL